MKLVIVEDEIRIREGLIHLLKKLAVDIDIAGVADNGSDGLELISKTHPDLIITDIKMPETDGLQMLETLHARQIPYKAIVLSAYSEFAYAQQAIKLGVSEYLIKPIAPDELLQSIKNIEAQINQEINLKAQSPQQFKALKNILYSIMLGITVVDDELSSFLKTTYRIDPKETFAIMDIYLGAVYEECIHPLKDELEFLLNNASFDCCIVEHPQGRELMLVLYNMADSKGIEKYFQHLIISQIKTIMPYDVAFGWISFCSLDSMKENMAKLRKFMDWSIVFGKKALISVPSVENIRFEPLPYPVDLESKAKAEICSLEYEKLSDTFLSLLNHLKSRIFSPAEVKETMIRFFWSIISVVKEIDFTTSEQLEQQALMEKIVTAITWSELKKTVVILIEALRDVKSDKTTSLTVRRAKSMVHECYGQGVTLDEIAAKLNITPEYLGGLFHKEVGETFSSYIKNYRVKKAKGLLIGTDMKIYDISSAIGYADSKYFSRVFKEITGQLPADFRKFNK